MNRLGDGWFEAVYAEDLDPWGFETTWYEARKRALTMAVLPQERYRSGFEPGCSLGLLTVALAGRCDALLSTDPVPAMVEQARTRVAAEVDDGGAVQVQRAAIPEDWPAAAEPGFDLILLSEVAYYLDHDGLQQVERLVGDTLVPGGDLVAVHWTGETDYPSTADEVHAALGASSALESWTAHREPDFRLDVWRRR